MRTKRTKPISAPSVYKCVCLLVASETMVDFKSVNHKGERMFYCKTHGVQRSKGVAERCQQYSQR